MGERRPTCLDGGDLPALPAAPGGSPLSQRRAASGRDSLRDLAAAEDEAEGVCRVPCVPQSVIPNFRQLPSPSGPTIPGAPVLTWVMADALPEVEGDDVPMDPQLRNEFSIEDMQRWCASNGHCVGFAFWADNRSRFHRDGWLYPKEKGTGFDEETVNYVKDKYGQEVWHWYYIKERARPPKVVVEEKVVHQAAVASTSLVNHDATFTPLAPEFVPAFLEARGFSTIDAQTWRMVEPLDWQGWMPMLTLSVKNHEEAGAHTWYCVHCELSLPSCERRVVWKAPRRLAHLRELHDHLKVAMGPEGYSGMLLDSSGQRVHFAHRGGMPGTTARLDAWFKALAASINAGKASPVAVALALHFLRAPPAEEPPGESDPALEEEEVAVTPWAIAQPESPHPHQTGRLM